MFRLLCISSLFIFSVSSHAISVDFDLTDPDSRTGVRDSTYARQNNYETDDLNLAITGWSNRGSNGRVGQAWVGTWNAGLGVERSRSPQHAVDNSRDDYDMLLLSFDQAVSLDYLSIGWKRHDSDASVLLFQSSGLPDRLNRYSDWDQILNDGWVLNGQYSNLSFGQSSVNNSGMLSQYWLVGAYNSALGGPSFTEGNDFFKLDGVGVSANVVPLPASLVLFLSGFGVIAFLRRRVGKKAAK